MFCPECGLEYVDNVTVCKDCGVALQPDRPEFPPEPTAEWVDLEPVLVTSNAALLAVARSLLEAEGLAGFARNELLQEWFRCGRLASGANCIVCPIQLQVPKERSAEARALRAAVEPAPIEPAGESAED